jgi:hypothetical protein
MSESEKEPDVEKADALVDEGLKLYSQGLLDQSLSKWRAALEEVPDHPRAKEYIKYVEDNRPALEDSFHLAASDAQTKDEVDSEADVSGVDQPKDDEGEDDDKQPPSEPMARGGAADPAGQVMLVAEPPPGRSQVPARIEATARMDVEELRARLNATKLRTKAHKLAQRDEDEPKGGDEPKDGDAAEQEEAADGTNSTSQEVHQRLTPSTLSPAVRGANEGGRDRKATPLVLVTGEGEKEEEGFEPLESTPLGVGMPEPTRLVSSRQGAGFAVGEATPVVDPHEGLPAGATPGGKHPSSTQTALGAPEEGERVESMLAGARQLLEQGTNEGSLWLCERVLSLDPDNDAAKKLLEDNRTVLLTQYQEQIGELEEVPVVQIPQHEIMWHKLDHRAGFLLSRIDGQLTYGDIIDVSGMGDFEATRILAQLQGMGVIGARK